ncbi:ribosome recycling factor-domain-containing protein [Aspergillus karnatakaensis]|uniref:ribosome-recycling factor n=1 Tax=Aspergillus karnatakaensis TaxID=1810916 RepID=UPI003CCE1828
MQRFAFQRLVPLAFRPLNRRAIYEIQLSRHTVRRTFSNSPFLSKGKKRDNAKQAVSELSSAETNITTEDSLDLKPLEDGIAAALSRLKDDLAKLRIGGRQSTESIESLRVHLSKGSKGTVKLGELAQVVPKGGRMVTVLVSEESYIKPITSAVLSSNLSLTPQPDPLNTLQINIPIPPPTKESRDKTVVAAKAAMDRAAGNVRDSRGVMHKRLQEAVKKRIARPDDARKSQDKMEKLSEKGQKEVKELFDAAKKALERA